LKIIFYYKEKNDLHFKKYFLTLFKPNNKNKNFNFFKKYFPSNQTHSTAKCAKKE